MAGMMVMNRRCLGTLHRIQEIMRKEDSTEKDLDRDHGYTEDSTEKV